MKANNAFVVRSSLILFVIGISAIATMILLSFPGNLHVWQVASWTLAFALLTLLVLVLASAYSLATNRSARTWRQIAAFSLGLACLAVIAVGSL